MKNIREIHDNLKSKKISCVELTSDFLARVKNSKTNSYLAISEEKALSEAKKIDEKISKGQSLNILDGIPIANKDVFLTKGVKSTAGSKFLRDYVPFTESTVTTKLANAGTICLGKLNMDEFAMGSNNEFSGFGACKNPWNLEHVPGGSSGGSAAAVAEGSVMLTTGSDTGGSIRLPSAYCGTVGMKPSYGRCSRYGMFSFASSLDQAGTLARNVYDVALGLDAIMGQDPKDSTTIREDGPKLVQAIESRPKDFLKNTKIGIPKNMSSFKLKQDVEKATSETINHLKKLGCTFVEVDLPLNEEGIAVYYIVAVSEASSNLSRYDGVRYTSRASTYSDINELYSKSRSEGFGEEVKRRIILGTFALSAGYYDAYFLKAAKIRRSIQLSFQKAFTQVDLLLSPVSTRTAPKMGEQMNDPLEMYLNDLFTIPVSLAGLPTMSLPIGLGDSRLPIGLQLIGNYKKEEDLIARAYQLEQSLGTENFLDQRK